MKKMVVGVVSAPGLPEKFLRDIMESLNELEGPSMEEDIDWDIDFKTDPLASSAEYINEIFDRLGSIQKENDWDMAIAVTDLPSISNKKVVLSEFDYDRKLSLVSVPAIGVFRNKKKLETLLVHHMEILYGKGSEEDTEDVQPDFINRIASVKSIDEEDERHRYILKSTVGGWLRLIGGMTSLNEPLTEFRNFRTIVALAFATGTYISIFRTPWELSLDYSAWRLILLMVIAVAGMVGWLIYAHNLWEMRSSRNQPAYRRLYNFTTLLTLLILTLVSYAVVSLLLTISILTFVPMGLFETWTDPNVELNVEWHDYLDLIWFAASAGILAGAFGSTVEEEDKIRNITYSYRQWYRYRQLEEEKEEESKADDEEADESGEKQEHDEKDEEEESYSGEKQEHDEAEEEK
ncbi:CopD family protein [Salinicoccus halitifaciens]|uniref:5,10-methylene-tetrahydrofolate dehydrogenase n=1 Tax=Salinicoccus halitifaciens TaxID=1073415 RepID=A0ABV2E934_9STAP|nr:CopD family protein [Salinicoccus halitifaciens]MCD2137711.1 CopD family protein [Salinicoccus halitifaciens]